MMKSRMSVRVLDPPTMDQALRLLRNIVEYHHHLHQSSPLQRPLVPKYHDHLRQCLSQAALAHGRHRHLSDTLGILQLVS